MYKQTIIMFFFVQIMTVMAINDKIKENYMILNIDLCVRSTWNIQLHKLINYE